jgi:hypothetical protein
MDPSIKRAADVIGFLWGVLAILLLAVGVREEAMVVPS